MMNKEQQRANFDYFDKHSPERKMELVDGRLIAGNSLAGSRLLLDHILRGWSVDAAVALGSIEQWSAALSAQQPDARLEYTAPDFTAGDEGNDGGHWRVRDHLYYWLWEAAETLGGQSLGRDFVMRLGGDGFTPDILFYKSAGLNTLYEYYLAGPAELVIEVVRPAHRDYDRRVKREYYARGGVPEYVIVDPERRQVEFLRLDGSSYAAQQPDAGGYYRPQSVPGLAITTEHMWVQDKPYSLKGEHNPFVVEQAHPAAKRVEGIEDGLGWDDLPFEPRLDLEPVRLRFEEYICWGPESKLEFWDGRIRISGEEGVRNVTGMLLATLGLAEACRFAPRASWLEALERRRRMESRDAQIRSEWRARAAKAAALLREKYHLERIAITGDLVSPRPLGFWSRLEVAAWGLPWEESDQAYKDLSAMDVDLVEAGGKYFQENLDKGKYTLEEI